MEHLLLRYGYLLLFLGVALEGETFLLAGAYLAHRGYFHLLVVIGVDVAANTLADQAYYFAARTRGRDWLEKRFRQNPKFQKVLARVSRHASWMLLASRYAFGFRIIIPAACGALGMPIHRFTLINLLAGLLWAIPTALLGFYLGEAAEVVLSRFHHYEIWGLMGAASNNLKSVQSVLPRKRTPPMTSSSLSSRRIRVPAHRRLSSSTV